MKRKILLLGGSSQQVIAIETAKRLGYYTILCDFLPDNPGQYVADKFYLVSTTDKEAVLKVAREEKVDGVLAYASDPAAPTAAYVAETLGLLTNPYWAVKTLCNKDMFRRFLAQNEFCTPRAEGYSSKEEAINEINSFRMPIIIKPVDSSGSKGVSVLTALDDVEKAVECAFSWTRCHRIIIEEFVEKKHPYLIGGDVFVQDGKIILWGLMNCHRDNSVNVLVPVGKSYPLDLEEVDICSVRQTLQELVDKLGIRQGAMNVEVIIDKENRVWLIDVGPRNGGNMIPDILSKIFDTDIVEMTIKTAMGDNVLLNIKDSNAFYATHNLHTNQSGVLEQIIFSAEIEKYIIDKNIYKKRGAAVEYFDNAAKALGVIFMKFETDEQMRNILDHINEHIQIIVAAEI